MEWRMRSIRSLGRNIRSHAVRVLPPICTEGLSDKLLGTSYARSKGFFSSSARGQESEEGSARAGQRSKSREWETDDQRGTRWRTGGRYQKSSGMRYKKRENTWQNSDPDEDLCRIKWDPDPTVIPDNWFRGHIPDMIKCKMFELWQEDPETNSAMMEFDTTKIDTNNFVGALGVSCIKALGKRFGLPFLDVQAILTMKQSAKEKVETIEGYEIYPEIEELMTERKEAYIEDLGIHYGQEIPFVYSQCPDMDKNDPSFWTEPREFKLAKLEEEDKSTQFDRPPLKGPDEVAEEMKYKRTIKAIYAAEREKEVEALTETLADKPQLPKRRWAYAMKDTSNKDTARAPVVMRDREGKMRGATVKEERCMSYADTNLFRRDVRRWTALREMP